MANNKKRVPPRKVPAIPKPQTFRITVDITEGQPPYLEWPGLDAYAVPSYLRKAAIWVEHELGLRE